MNFLTPAAFALAALIPIIVAMYLLKLRRTEQTISSVYLWRRMVRDVEANAPWQRLRRNLLLLLQLLFTVVLMLALARPFTWAEGLGGQSVVFVVDTSASMAATDLSPSRIGAARQQMHHLVDGLPTGAQVTVISAGTEVQVRVSSSRDRRQIRGAIDAIGVETGRSNLSAALELAAAIAARQPDSEIVVLSDFAGIGDTEPLSSRLSASVPIRTLPLGNSGDNQAISTLSLQPAPDGSAMTAFVQVVNYSDEPVQRRLVLSVDTPGGGEEVMINAYDLAIPLRGQEAVIAEDLPMDVHLLEAQWEGEDVLPLDDRAWAVYRETSAVDVTLVSDGNRFLETALALLSGLDVTTVRPADYETGRLDDTEANTTQPADRPAYQSAHLTIFDAYVPITATEPAGSVLYIAPPRSTDPFSVTGVLEQPAPVPADRTDPLLAHVDLGEVGVLKAAHIPLPGWARAVVVDGAAEDEAPLLLVGEVDGRRTAVLAFDLHDSDLPLQVGFPLLLANLTGWLAPGRAGQLPAQVEAGMPVTVMLPPHVDALTVTRPDGATSHLTAENGRAVLADTGQLGVYQVAWSEAPLPFAVNLNLPGESDVEPGDVDAIAGQATGTGTAAALQQARREWWRPLAFLALAFLVAEWLVYQRGSVVRLWHWVRLRYRQRTAS